MQEFLRKKNMTSIVKLQLSYDDFRVQVQKKRAVYKIYEMFEEKVRMYAFVNQSSAADYFFLLWCEEYGDKKHLQEVEELLKKMAFLKTKKFELTTEGYFPHSW